MKKLAIFSERQTGQIFCEHLIRHLAQQQHVAVQTRALEGARERRVVRISGDAEDADGGFFALLFNCGQDDRVLSDVRERYDGLVREGFCSIVALRDVYPKARSSIPRIRDTFRKYLKSDPLSVPLILAIMEIEAWFLAEHTHFSRMHEKLTADLIKSKLGFSPHDDDLQLRDVPSKDLDDVYFLVTLIYDKSRARVERTVNALDFDEVSDNVSRRFPDLRSLVQVLVEFLSTDER